MTPVEAFVCQVRGVRLGKVMYDDHQGEEARSKEGLMGEEKGRRRSVKSRYRIWIGEGG